MDSKHVFPLNNNLRNSRHAGFRYSDQWFGVDGSECQTTLKTLAPVCVQKQGFRMYRPCQINQRYPEVRVTQVLVREENTAITKNDVYQVEESVLFRPVGDFSQREWC